MDDKTFQLRKKKLRAFYKKLKAGLVEWDDIPEYYQKLLVKYYGIKVEYEW